MPDGRMQLCERGFDSIRTKTANPSAFHVSFHDPYRSVPPQHGLPTQQSQTTAEAQSLEGLPLAGEGHFLVVETLLPPELCLRRKISSAWESHHVKSGAQALGPHLL